MEAARISDGFLSSGVEGVRAYEGCHAKEDNPKPQTIWRG
jgi:hypothetical protein